MPIVKVNGADVDYIQTGSGRDLVLLHSLLADRTAFDHVVPALAKKRRLTLVNLPGYGGSAPLATVTIGTLADALDDFLATIGASKPIVVGHSIGGMIVQEWLVKHPTVASAVVLAQTSPAFGKADGDWQKAFIEARLGPLSRGETMASLAPGLVTELVGENPDADGMALARDCMAEVPEASYRASMMALLGFDRRHALKDIRVPTLVLSGSRDGNAPAPMMAKMASYIPRATYVELDGAGHLVNLERPDAFNSAVKQFLATDAVVTGVTA